MGELDKSYSSSDWTESDFRAFAALIPDPLFVLNSLGNIVHVNQRTERLLGYSNTELFGRKLDFILPSNAEQSPEQHLLHSKSALQVIGARHKNGTEFPVEINLSAAQTPRGAFIVGTMREISGRAADAAWFGGLLEAAPDSMVIVDQRGLITLVNAQTETLFGYSPAELIGQPVEILVPERDRDAHGRDRSAYAAQPRRRPMGVGLELFGRRKDGSEFPVEISLSPLQTAKGGYIISVVRDVSARKQAELQTRQLNRELQQALHRSEKLAATGRLVATIAHEINNPLETLMNVLHLLESDPGLRPDSKELVQIAEQEVSRLDNLSRLTLAPHRESKFPEVTRVCEMLDDILTMFQPKLDSAHITVLREYRGEAEVTIFPSELRQVFTNLIANAIDAMNSHGGELTLTVDKTAEGEVLVKIADNGCGIPAEHLNVIFEPFFTTKGEQGTGIGLWVIASIVEKAGGRIEVTSSTKGEKGTTFSVFLPAGLARRYGAAAEPKAAVEPAPAAEVQPPIAQQLRREAEVPFAPPAAARILFVDDEASMRETLPAILTRHNFAVTAAGTVDEALATIARNRFDVLISDLNIGQSGDGFAVIETMRQAQPECIAIILTGYPGFQSALKAIQHRVHHYLIKPTRPQELIAAINDSLARARHSGGNQRIALLLEDHASEIARRMLKHLKADARLAALPLTDTDLVGYIPEVLRQVAERLEFPSGSALPAENAGKLIAEIRKRQGYEVHWLWNDLKHLQRAIYDAIRPQVQNLNPAYLLPELMLLNENLTALFETAVRAFGNSANAA